MTSNQMNSNQVSYFKYYINGMLSGCVATIVSHPFFTIKTCLQNGSPYQTSLQFLYRGFNRAFIGYGIEKTLVFGTYNSILKKMNLNRNNPLHSGIAGFLSGIVGSLSITVAEQLTIDKQLGVRNYNVMHLYKGLYPTMYRESIGFTIYFTVYDQLSKRFNQSKKTMNTIAIGTMAITSAWSIITPIDKIKTNIQSGVKIDVHNLVTAYKGFQFALMRAIPFHVTCFVVFEKLMKLNWF